MTKNRRASDAARIIPIDSPRARVTNRKREMGLTDEERRLLLDELAEITAELDELHNRAAEIAARVTSPESARLDRPA
jgi:hypothetical protein